VCQRTCHLWREDVVAKLHDFVLKYEREVGWVREKDTESEKRVKELEERVKEVGGKLERHEVIVRMEEGVSRVVRLGDLGLVMREREMVVQLDKEDDEEEAEEEQGRRSEGSHC
jgi:hypothetical protein